MIACGILELVSRSFNSGLQRRGYRGRVVSIAMKRLLIALICLSIFYASAVWALQGCTDLEMQAHPAHHTDHSSEIPGRTSHHSHSDPSQIHCPNLLSEFLISSPLSLQSGSARMHYAVHDTATIKGLLRSIILEESNGPPGPLYSMTLPRHLLLSVIRI
jgi:hypothetical protein